MSRIVRFPLVFPSRDHHIAVRWTLKKLVGFRVVLRIMVANVFKVADYGRNKLRPYVALAICTSENTDHYDNP